MQDLTIVIKTFIRYSKLKNCVNSLRKLTNAPILIIDDTPLQYRQTLEWGENIFQYESQEDIGLSAGRNLGFELAKTPYIFYTDDDSDLSEITKDNFEKAFNFIKDNENCNIVGDGNCILELKDSILTTFHEQPEEDFYITDMIWNTYFAKREFLLENPYDERLKIGGEHIEFFFRLKKEGKIVHGTTCLNGWKNDNTTNDIRYRSFRARSFINLVLEKHNLTKIVAGKKPFTGANFCYFQRLHEGAY